MNYINLINAFDREIEVLEVTEDAMIYAVDRKDDSKTRCDIEKLDFNLQKTEPLIRLDYTRIYESFQTYRQNPDFFYAVNVLSDYRVRLRRVDKQQWQIHEDILLNAEGEVLSLYVLDERYLLVTDEVVKDETYTKIYGEPETDSRYMTLCYLYDVKTGEKFPITDRRFGCLPDTVRTYRTPHGLKTMIITADRALYTTDTKAFAAAASSGQTLPMTAVRTAEADGPVYFISDNPEGFYYRINSGQTETVYFCGCDGSEKQLYVYPYDSGETYFYDMTNGHIFCTQSQDGEKSVKRLACVTDSMLSLSFEQDYGDFTGICTKDLFLTAFYKEVQVKEDTEFRECVAVHYMDGRTPDIFEGRCMYDGGKVILLRSFLAL